MSSPFTIYVIQSAHTDIGYTHPQEQIALMYLDSYDRVLELCRQSAHLPEEQRFKWTCETSWQVQHYVTSRPEREAEFLAYVRSGQIEITASYLHFTDMIDEDAYRRSLAWIVAYCQRNALPLRTAMHCDINGWPWAIADILTEYHIPFFCSQVHIEHGTDPLGRRGSVHYGWLREQGAKFRADAPFRIPQAFWWEGPAGGRVLHWLNEHYHLGNVLGVSSPYGFGARKTRHFVDTDKATVENLYTLAHREIPLYVRRLQEEGYPYDALLLSTGGFYVDNSPPDDRWCQVIARFNTDHDDIVLRTATLGEWFELLAQKDQGNWPAFRVAWPDHWAHGLGSYTARIAQERRSQRRRKAIIELVQQAQSAEAASYLEIALQQELLAVEHTFDAWSTTAQPTSSLNHFQQTYKELAFHKAELYLDEAVDTALRKLIPIAQEEPTPTLYLRSNRQEAGTHIVNFAADDLVIDPSHYALQSSNGEVYPFQWDDKDLLTFVAALPLEKIDLTGFRLVPHAPATISLTAITQIEQPDYAVVLETTSWRLCIDPLTGGLQSFQDVGTMREWVAPGQHSFGQLVHELVVHPAKYQAVGNTARLISLDVASEEMRQSFSPEPIFTHSSLTMEDTSLYLQGPVFDAVVMHGSAENIGKVQVTWRGYHALPLIELVLDWEKSWNELPEAAYVAFPFQVHAGKLALETAGGFFQPGSHESGGQLPGTCSSYYTMQRAARITAPDGEQLLWLPVDAPLVMPNEMKYNRWETTPWHWNGFLASMPVNHYWHTNFPTSQRGPIRLRYRIINPRGFANEEQAIQAALPLDAFGWR